MSDLRDVIGRLIDHMSLDAGEKRFNTSEPVVLVAQEIVVEGRETEEGGTARLFASRAQMRALGKYGLSLVKQGRPVCGNCGQPIDPEGHFCPRRNGHKH